MTTVRDVLKVKGDAIWSTTSKASVYEALETMANKNVGALVVLDNGKLVGIFSERDYARKIILKNRASKHTPVSEIMSRRIVCVGPDRGGPPRLDTAFRMAGAEDGAEIMNQHGCSTDASAIGPLAAHEIVLPLGI